MNAFARRDGKTCDVRHVRWEQSQISVSATPSNPAPSNPAPSNPAPSNLAPSNPASVWNIRNVRKTFE